MSIGRPAIIAAQTLVVGVLVVVVYLTLLKPEQESTLSGVDAPAGTQASQSPVGPGGGDGRRDGDRRERRERGGDRGPAGGSTLVAATVPAPVGAVPLATVAPVGGPGAGSQSPGSDQYQDALSRITDRLR